MNTEQTSKNIFMYIRLNAVLAYDDRYVKRKVRKFSDNFI